MVGTRCRRSKVIEFDPEASSAGTLGIEETCDGNLAGVSRFELGLANSESSCAFTLCPNGAGDAVIINILYV